MKKLYFLRAKICVCDRVKKKFEVQKYFLGGQMMGKRKSVAAAGILAGAIVFLFGFTIMFVLWKMLGTRSGLPGLFDYKAASIGDSICLPILTGSLVMFLRANSNLDKTQKVIVQIAVILALLAGICIQMKWLLDDDTKLNWSIPITHYFNAAGWYHSLFFIGMFGAAAGLLFAAYFTFKNKAGNIRLCDCISVGTAMGAGNLFLLLHIADDYTEADNRYLFAAVTVITMAVVVLLTRKAARNNAKKFYGYLAGALGVSYFAALFICENIGTESWLAGIAVAAAACILWQPEKQNMKELVIKDVMTALVTYGAFTMALMSESRWIVLTAGFAMIITSIIVEKIANGEVRFHFVPMAVIIIYTCSNLFLADVKGGSEVAFLVFSSALTAIMKMKIGHSFEYVIQTEENINRGGRDNLAGVKAKEYLQLGICAVSLVSIVIYWAQYIVTSYSVTVEKGSMISNFYLCGGVVMCFIALYALGCTCLKGRKASIVLAAILLFCIHGGILVNYWMNIQSISSIRADISTIIVLVFGFFTAIGSPLMLADGFYRNLAGLYYAEKKPVVMIFAVLNGILCLIHNFVMIFGQLVFASWGTILLTVCNTIIIYLLLPVLCARVIKEKSPEQHVITASSLGGIRQDGFLIALIVIAVVCIPSSFVSLIYFDNIIQFCGVVSALTPVFIPLVICLENNVGNIRRQKEVLKKYPEEEVVWIRLKKSLRRQNILTMFTLIPYIFVCMLIECSQEMIANRSVKELKKNLVGRFLGEK